MPEFTNCPECDRQLRVPEEYIGKKVKCPTCGVMFTASATRSSPFTSSDRGTSNVLTPERAVKKLKWVAFLLLVTGIVGTVVDIFSLTKSLTFDPEDFERRTSQVDPQLRQILRQGMESASEPTGLIIGSLFLTVSLVVTLSAVVMFMRRLHVLAVTGSILAMVNLGNCCCIVGLPIGIWSLVLLFKPEVRSIFD